MLMTLSSFVDASPHNLQVILDAFALYGSLSLSGQRVNWEKSSIFFGKGISGSRITNFLSMSRMRKGGVSMTYLGVPIFIGEPKRRWLIPWADKIQSKLESWKGFCLSMAGLRIVVVVNRARFFTQDHRPRTWSSIFWGKQIWASFIPPSRSVLIWRLFHGKIPTNIALRARGYISPSRCRFCCAAEEDLKHLFLDCLFVRGLWDAVSSTFGWFFCTYRGFVKGCFAIPLGVCFAFEAELAAAVHTIDCAWTFGWWRLWLESDSTFVVDTLRSRSRKIKHTDFFFFPPSLEVLLGGRLFFFLFPPLEVSLGGSSSSLHWRSCLEVCPSSSSLHWKSCLVVLLHPSIGGLAWRSALLLFPPLEVLLGGSSSSLHWRSCLEVSYSSSSSDPSIGGLAWWFFFFPPLEVLLGRRRSIKGLAWRSASNNIFF
ncbi:hypothetical protein Dsin_018972 [Dipteronia sinensis]|uniref:Reverse transcriptase zinc-binding domain-containing protein n=1 Tax=Dipteronia sinensis TaxID=43782 RepID=A0AAE0E2J8_9ROSI|nr:hypothetical protein Dsin_018972 [Dipteronia sinensis]